MASIDLKPVSDETIEEMGYTNQDLWFVKKDATVYGPFETLSLKHYSAENSALFIDTVACVSDSQVWTPFYEIAGFERPAEMNYEHSEGPFWVLVDGQKSAPLTKHDLQKKIEMNIIPKTDLFSADEGHTWHKIYEIPEFDHRHEPDQLPDVPGEKSFQKAKLELVDKIEHSQGQSQQDGLASLAHLGQKKNDKTIVLKLDEVTLHAVQETDVSRSLKWAIPAMFGCVLTMGLTAWYIFTPKADAPLAEVSEEAEERMAKPEVIMPRIQYQPRMVNEQNVQQEMPVRRPASVDSMRGQERSVLTRSRSMPQSEFPTVMETHGDSQDRDDSRDVDQAPERAPVDEPSNLVQQAMPNPDESSLDSEMNREPANHDPAIDPPVLEEATDF